MRVHLRGIPFLVSAIAAAMLMHGIAHAQGPLAVEGARYTMSFEPPVTMEAEGFDWEPEIQVALPATYGALPDTTYPVLWVMDGPGMIHLVVGVLDMLVMANQAPEMIVVAVGTPSEAGAAVWGRRRTSEFYAPGKWMPEDGVAGEFLKEHDMGNEAVAAMGQKGDKYLAFLIDRVRPALAGRYRMSGAHALFGHSAGGVFTAHAIFARPGAFSKFIIGSAGGKHNLRLEQAYAEAHDDLKASVFIGAGDLETDEIFPSAWGIVSHSVWLGETLRLRRYPSLRVTVRVFSGKDHMTVVPDIILEGIRTVWAEEISRL